MKKIKSIIKKLIKRKKIWISLLILIATLFICKFTVSGQFLDRNKDEIVREYTVEREDIAVTISASGTIQPKQTMNLVFGSSGFIGEVNVEEGDTVNQDDILATLDPTPFNNKIAISNASVQSAQSNYAKSNNNFNVEVQELNNQITSIAKDLAEVNYSTTIAVNTNSIDKQEIDLEISELDLESSDDSLDILEDEADEAIDSSSNQNLTELQYDSQINQSESSLTTKELQNDQKEIDLDSLEKNNDYANLSAQKEIKRQEYQLALGEKQKEQKKYEQQHNLNSLSAQINQSKANLQSSQYDLAKSKIHAPFQGIVLDVPLTSGEYYSGPGNSSILIADISELNIEAEINELDILDVEIGQKTIVKIEANRSIQVEGVISKIIPNPVIDSSGVTNYIVKIQLQNNAKNIYIGLNTEVEIVYQEVTDVISIPLVALNQKEDGIYVQIKEDGQLVDRKVEVGIENDTNTEIIGGLEVGDVIYY